MAFSLFWPGGGNRFYVSFIKIFCVQLHRENELVLRSVSSIDKCNSCTQVPFFEEWQVKTGQNPLIQYISKRKKLKQEILLHRNIVIS